MPIWSAMTRRGATGAGRPQSRPAQGRPRPDTFARLKQAAIARQAWAVQGNSALADYYWGALGDYEDGRFVDPARSCKA
jgi:hypothetical protein